MRRQRLVSHSLRSPSMTTFLARGASRFASEYASGSGGRSKHSQCQHGCGCLAKPSKVFHVSFLPFNIGNKLNSHHSGAFVIQYNPSACFEQGKIQHCYWENTKHNQTSLCAIRFLCASVNTGYFSFAFSLSMCYTASISTMRNRKDGMYAKTDVYANERENDHPVFCDCRLHDCRQLCSGDALRDTEHPAVTRKTT